MKFNCRNFTYKRNACRTWKGRGRSASRGSESDQFGAEIVENGVESIGEGSVGDEASSEAPVEVG